MSGAAYSPESLTLPPAAPSTTFQVTVASALPVTAAVSWAVLPTCTEAVAGDTVTTTATTGAGFTVIVADALAAASARLVATRW